ncbi:MAG: type II secretion system protein GspI [Candidatus Electrothrix sp. AW2]|nr:type II secretion system protein GspI [Candidatus Electrothrix gigas]
MSLSLSLSSQTASSHKGFTLLEVMIAVAIIAMTFVSMLASQSQSLSIAEISRFETMAAMLAQQKMTELQLEEFDELGNDSGSFADEFANYSWQTEVRELNEDDTGIEDVEGMLKFISLTVRRGQDDTKVFTLQSIIMAKIQPADAEEK